jgi:hypothetical protein
MSDVPTEPGLSSLRDEAADASSPEASIPIARWRKKPIVVDAWQWDGCAPQWLRPDWVNASGCRTFDGIMIVPTLEGEIIAHPSDWIIRGVEGEVYPCKLSIFNATYEPAPAQGIEAQRAETGTGSVHESPVAGGDAPIPGYSAEESAVLRQFNEDAP